MFCAVAPPRVRFCAKVSVQPTRSAIASGTATDASTIGTEMEGRFRRAILAGVWSAPPRVASVGIPRANLAPRLSRETRRQSARPSSMARRSRDAESRSPRRSSCGSGRRGDAEYRFRRHGPQRRPVPPTRWVTTPAEHNLQAPPSGGSDGADSRPAPPSAARQRPFVAAASRRTRSGSTGALTSPPSLSQVPTMAPSAKGASWGARSGSAPEPMKTRRGSRRRRHLARGAPPTRARRCALPVTTNPSARPRFSASSASRLHWLRRQRARVLDPHVGEDGDALGANRPAVAERLERAPLDQALVGHVRAHVDVDAHERSLRARPRCRAPRGRRCGARSRRPAARDTSRRRRRRASARRSGAAATAAPACPSGRARSRSSRR